MHDPGYRDTILDAVELLDEMEERLFTALVNTGMYGVYREVHRAFSVGDSYEFELRQFEDTGDASLDALLALLRHTVTTRERLRGLNELEDGPEGG
ncbi:MAG: hypothetical protein EOO11_05010 [Chitinophagaceae bacterium]|nr:MAG: hypothetical protein EOO11_05010 [Chitinophagaceae bacterium]